MPITPVSLSAVYAILRRTGTSVSCLQLLAELSNFSTDPIYLRTIARRLRHTIHEGARLGTLIFNGNGVELMELEIDEGYSTQTNDDEEY